MCLPYRALDQGAELRFPNWTRFKSKKGNLIIFQKQGGRVVPLYLLRTSVKIPPRLGLRDTLEAGLPFFVDKALDAMLREVRNG
jgi:hypothetical protein